MQGTSFIYPTCHWDFRRMNLSWHWSPFGSVLKICCPTCWCFDDPERWRLLFRLCDICACRNTYPCSISCDFQKVMSLVAEGAGLFLMPPKLASPFKWRLLWSTAFRDFRGNIKWCEPMSITPRRYLKREYLASLWGRGRASAALCDKIGIACSTLFQFICIIPWSVSHLFGVYACWNNSGLVKKVMGM